MRQTIKDFVSIVSNSFPIIEPIVEFGSLQVPGQEGFADLRSLFPEKEYIGCDIREGTGVDKILDLHNIELPSASVGTVLCLDTLEHVEYPHRAMEEIHRILKPHGIAVISSVMNWHIHDHPYDFWRFTPEAFKSIMKPFSHSFVGFAGDESFPHTIVGIGFKGDSPSLSEFSSKYDTWRRGQTKVIRQIVRGVIPPIILPVLSRLRRTIIRLLRSLT